MINATRAAMSVQLRRDARLIAANKQPTWALPPVCRTRRARTTVALAVGVLMAWVAVLAAAPKADVGRLTPHAIEITARSVEFDRENPERRDFGRLIWRGGLELRSTSPYFGGYSGLVLDATGTRLLAISDSGSWLSAKIDHSDGRMSGLSEARIGAIPQKDGRPLPGMRYRDAESLVPVSPGSGLDGRYLISFEGKHRIDEYAFEKGVMTGPLGTHALPANLRRMSSNAGLEAVGILRGGPHAGALVMFAERLLTPGGDHTGAIVIGGKASPLTLARVADFDPTDAKGLPDGSLLVLERSFNRANFRLQTRLRLVPANEIKPGARLVGEELLRAGLEMRIDNFEGMALTEGAKGETIITLISDDNFNFFQQTLLMQFELKK